MKSKIPFDKISFFSDGRFEKRNIAKEELHIIKRRLISNWSLVMVAMLLATSTIYYSALIMDYLGITRKLFIFLLIPVWFVFIFVIYHSLTGSKFFNNSKEK